MGLELLFARDSVAPEGYTFSIDGDLNQMGEQQQFLRHIFIDVQQSGVVPVIKSEDVKRALTAIFGSRVPGWWHYKSKYIELGICTAEEFKSALEIQVKRNKE